MTAVAIIGGGASGLMAALTASRAGADVTLYEHNQSIGKKILASGNGRCNIINTTAFTHDYFGTNPHFVTYGLKHFPFSEFESFCLSIGLVLDVKEDGRCYPLCNEAKAVVNAFKNALNDTGVKIMTENKVIAITKSGKNFQVQSNDDTRHFDKVLIATGSEAAPQLGATDDGYRFARSFGHDIVSPYPSLVQLHLKSKNHHKMAGVKTYAEVTLYINGKQKEKVEGDILFASYGISGLAVLDISQKASSALMKKESVSLSLNLLPRYERQELNTLLEKLSQSVPAYTIETLLAGLIPAKMASSILEDAAISAHIPASRLGIKEIKKISHLLQEWRFEVSDTHGFKHAEVSGGGVSTAQVNSKTMESEIVKGLYFAGEVLDIVGKRGGYNFNFAWVSGMIAGKEMAK